MAGAWIAHERPSRPFWGCATFGSAVVVGFALWRGGGAPQPADGLLVLAVVSAAIGYAEGGRLALPNALAILARRPGRNRMALIAIAKKHHLSHQKARTAAGKVAKDLNARFDLEYAWQGDHIQFKRPGLTGALHVGKDAVRLDCELGFMLSLLKPSIEAEVHKQFDKYFGKAK